MRIWFETDRTTARRGESVSLGAFIENTFGTAIDVSWAIESDPALEWSVLPPSRLPAQTTTPVTVQVEVPRDLPSTRTAVAVEMMARLAHTDLWARATTVIEVAGSPRGCAAYTTAPSVRLNADGTATLTAGIVNCGPVNLTVDLRVRHVDGWVFDVDVPKLTLAADAGPVTVTTVVGQPNALSIEAGDHLRVELIADGNVLASATVSLRAPESDGRRPARRFVSSGLVAALLVLAAAAIGNALSAGDPPEAPPMEVTAGASEASDPDVPPPRGADPAPNDPPPAEVPQKPPAKLPPDTPPPARPEHTIVEFDATPGEDCEVSLEWDTAGEGTVHLSRTLGDALEELRVEPGANRALDPLGDVLRGLERSEGTAVYRLTAVNVDGVETDTEEREAQCSIETPLPDLVVVGTGQDGVAPYAVIANSGAAPAGPFVVRITNLAFGDPFAEERITVDGLPPGEQVTVTWACAQDEAAIEVDVDDAIAEPDESNNFASLSNIACEIGG